MAITFNAVTASFYSAQNGTSITLTYPAGLVVNEILVLVIGMKPSTANSGSVTTPAGWTPVPNGSQTGAGGYGTTLGADTGNTNVFSFYRVVTGTLTGNFTVTIAASNVAWANMVEFRNDSGSWEVAGATGQDTAAGNVSIVTSPTLALRPGDELIGAMVIPSDVTTPAQFSAQAFTATGVTFGAITELAEPDSTTGNDIGGFLCYGEVTANTVTAAVTLSATAGGTTTNVRGPGLVVRLREVIGPVQALQTSGFTDGDTFESATVTLLGPKQNLAFATVTTPANTFDDSWVRATALQLIATAAVSYFTGNANYTLPSGVQAGDLLLAIAGYKGNDPSAEVGLYFPSVSLSGFVGVAGGHGFGDSNSLQGIDTGLTGHSIQYIVADGTESGATRLFELFQVNVAWLQVLHYRPSGGNAFVLRYEIYNQQTASPATLTAVYDGINIAELGTQIFSATTSLQSDSNVGAKPMLPGDEVLWYMVIPTDVTTPAQFSNYTFASQSGVSLSSLTEVAEPDTASAFDLGGFVARGTVAISSPYAGTSDCSLSVNVAGTLTNVHGPLVFVLLRHTYVVNLPTGFDESTDTFGAWTLAGGAPTAEPLRTAFFAVF